MSFPFLDPSHLIYPSVRSIWHEVYCSIEYTFCPGACSGIFGLVSDAGRGVGLTPSGRLSAASSRQVTLHSNIFLNGKYGQFLLEPQWSGRSCIGVSASGWKLQTKWMRLRRWLGLDNALLREGRSLALHKARMQCIRHWKSFWRLKSIKLSLIIPLFPPPNAGCLIYLI